MTTAVVFLIIYFLAMIGIGVWSMRKSENTNEDYLLAGRSLGPAVSALRLQSSCMSGYMFLGAGSQAYTQGYFSMWYALGDLGGGVLNLSVLGRRMRKLSKILGSITSIEYLEHRYDSGVVRLVAAVISLFCLFLYLLSQFIAGGSGLSSVTGIDFELSLLIASGVIVLYTFLGGYLAVAYTDFVQAIIMLIGMVWVLIGALQYVGGLSAGHEGLADKNPNLLTMFGADLQYEGQWGLILGALLIFSIGYLGWPHIVVSHMAMKKPSVARKASAYSMAFNILFIPAPYIIGMMAILILPNLADPEQAIFEVAKTVLPSFAVGIVMAAVMAAIMSTADALLLQASTIASRDLAERFIFKNLTEKQMVNISRATVVAMAFGGIVLAIWQPPSVFGLTIFATTILGSAFVPAYVCAVWWKKANKVGAVASMIVGTVISVSWEVSGMTDATGLDPMVAGIVSSTIAMIIGSLATQKSHPVPQTIVDAVNRAADIEAPSARVAMKEDANLSVQMPEKN